MGFEVLLLPIIAALWLYAVIRFIGGVLADVLAWVRGKPSPRLADMQTRSKSRGGSGRREARAYASDVWADTWRGLRKRRTARIAARERGDVPPPRGGRVSRWWGHTRERVSAWWDERTLRVDDRRQAEQIHDTEQVNGRGTLPERVRDAVVVERISDPEATQPEPDRREEPTPDPDPTPDQPTSPAPDNVIQIDRDSRRADAAGGNTNQQKEQDMAEVTGLATAIRYAADQQTAHEQAVADGEGFAASLAANDVSGPAVAAARRAMELEQQTAAAWAEAAAALEQHQQVKEAYDSNPDAGRKEFVTAE